MTRDADTRQVTREQIAKALAAHWPAGMKRLRWTPEGWAKVLFATLPQPAPVADGEPRTRSGQAWLNDLHEPKGPCYDSPHCEHGAPILAIEAEAVGQNDANYRAGFRDGQCEAAQPAPGLDALAAAYHKARLRYATGTYYCGSESGPFEFDSGPCSCRMDMRETLAEYARLRGDE
jgi:hypothetical protein